MERDQPAGAAPARLGRLDGDPPGVPVGAPAQGAHLAVQAEQRVADPGGPRGLGHRVDRLGVGPEQRSSRRSGAPAATRSPSRTVVALMAPRWKMPSSPEAPSSQRSRSSGGTIPAMG